MISLKTSNWTTRTCTKLYTPSTERISSTRYVVRPIQTECKAYLDAQIRYIATPDRLALMSDVHAFINLLHTRRGRPSSGIVYCRHRATCDELALYLRQRAINAKPYHRGLKYVFLWDWRHAWVLMKAKIERTWQDTKGLARRRRWDWWSWCRAYSQLKVYSNLTQLAGMCNNCLWHGYRQAGCALHSAFWFTKEHGRWTSNCWCMYHWLYHSYIGYYQETGRAGRDGEVSLALLWRWLGGLTQRPPL